jgi:hypothetical protein
MPSRRTINPLFKRATTAWTVRILEKFMTTENQILGHLHGKHAAPVDVVDALAENLIEACVDKRKVSRAQIVQASNSLRRMFAQEEQ